MHLRIMAHCALLLCIQSCLHQNYDTKLRPLPVLCLITPWLQMDRNRQIDQIATLSREHIISCAYRLHSEAGLIFISHALGVCP